jgi:glycine cleavage system aminomethyltransferase T
MDTHQRLAKRLVVLQVASEQGARAGDEVQVDGAKVGQVTSVTPLASGGTVKALAYVKSGVAEPGRELTILGRDGMLAVTVLALPGE